MKPRIRKPTAAPPPADAQAAAEGTGCANATHVPCGPDCLIAEPDRPLAVRFADDQAKTQAAGSVPPAEPPKPQEKEKKS
jgi:hypothetical protein